LRLLQYPKWGTLFDSGFHCDRGAAVPLAMLTVFLEAKIALSVSKVPNWQQLANNKVSRRVDLVQPPLAFGSTIARRRTR
jgi:hypothetical protein